MFPEINAKVPCIVETVQSVKLVPCNFRFNLTSKQSFFLCVIAPQFSHAPFRYFITEVCFQNISAWTVEKRGVDYQSRGVH